MTPPRRSSWLGMIAGTLMGFRRKRPKTTSEDLNKHEFSTSTQRKGFRFTEHLRDAFRHRWLKKH